MSVPGFQVTVSRPASVCMNQTARSSGPFEADLEVLGASIPFEHVERRRQEVSAIAAFLEEQRHVELRVQARAGAHLAVP